MRLSRDVYSGFTLMELMLVAAIIGVLAAIAIPKFGNLIIKAKEAQVKGKLGAYRSAISIYYSENEGLFPQDDTQSLFPKYLDGPLFISIPGVGPWEMRLGRGKPCAWIIKQTLVGVRRGLTQPGLITEIRGYYR